MCRWKCKTIRSLNPFRRLRAVSLLLENQWPRARDNANVRAVSCACTITSEITRTRLARTGARTTRCQQIRPPPLPHTHRHYRAKAVSLIFEQKRVCSKSTHFVICYLHSAYHSVTRLTNSYPWQILPLLWLTRLSACAFWWVRKRTLSNEDGNGNKNFTQK